MPDNPFHRPVLFEGLYAHQSTDDHGAWWRRVHLLVQLTGHLEPCDVLCRIIAQDVGGCTFSYLKKDLVTWRWHELRIHHHLRQAPKGYLESEPTWS